MVSGLAKFPGGVESVVAELSKYSGAHNAEVDVFARSNQDFIEQERRCRLIGVRDYSFIPHGFGIPHYGKYEYNLRVWRKTKQYGPYDLIHGHGDNCVFTALFRDKTPFLMTFHGTIVKVLQDSSDPRKIPHVYTEKIAASRCDLAVACSEAVKKELIQYYGCPAKKIRVIHNGVNTEKFTPMDKQQARKRLSLSPNQKYALWVGSNPQRKRLSMAIKAVSISKCSKLLVVGINGKNTEKTVFLGKIPEQDLIAAYSAADVLIFPTVYEGFPLAPLEALACGLPIIVSEESNMGEIIKDGVQGFVINDDNPVNYQEKIDLIINDDSRLGEMAIKSRALALNYSWFNQAEKYWKIYKELLK
jgi:glycosyltransferase involved in cell wall biosynthesis